VAFLLVVGQPLGPHHLAAEARCAFRNGSSWVAVTREPPRRLGAPPLRNAADLKGGPTMMQMSDHDARYRWGATHHVEIPETPAKSPDAQTYCATATLTKRRSVNVHIWGGCDIPASNYERARNFEPSSARRIARVSGHECRAQAAPTARSRTRTAEDMTAKHRQSTVWRRAAASNSAPPRPPSASGSKQIATREYSRGGDRHSTRASDRGQ
jgi:hypothetical protein